MTFITFKDQVPEDYDEGIITTLSHPSGSYKVFCNIKFKNLILNLKTELLRKEERQFCPMLAKF